MFNLYITEYFINVLDDLDLTPIDKLVSIRELLKADHKDLDEASQAAQKSVVVAIKSMRNIANWNQHSTTILIYIYIYWLLVCKL